MKVVLFRKSDGNREEVNEIGLYEFNQYFILQLSSDVEFNFKGSTGIMLTVSETIHRLVCAFIQCSIVKYVYKVYDY